MGVEIMTSIEKLNKICKEYKNILFVTKGDAPWLINIYCTPDCTSDEVDDFLQNVPFGVDANVLER